MSNEQPPAVPAVTPQVDPTSTPPAIISEKPARNTLGLVALGLAIFGAILAIVPATNGFSWLVLFAAFILAIIGLTRKGQGKATSLTALILSFLFWIISIFVGIGVIAGGVAESIDDQPSISEPDESEEPVVEESPAEEESPVEEDGAGIGDTVTTDSGVAVTLVGVENGVLPPNDFIISEVRGQLVAVNISMDNGSEEAVAISTSTLLGFIGNAEYEAAGVFGTDSGEWYIFEEINPGLIANFTAYFDIPADASLERVTFQTSVFFGEEATFTLQ